MRCIVAIGDKDPEHIAWQVDELTTNGRLFGLDEFAHHDKAPLRFPIPEFQAELAQRVDRIKVLPLE
jgi:hypothetical protein